MRELLCGLLLAWLWLAPVAGAEDYLFPARPAGTGEARRLLIYGTTDLVAMRPLIEGFQQGRPRIAVTYAELDSGVLYERFLQEQGSAGCCADVLLSSAMDLQLKLANDGYAQPFTPGPERPVGEASWRDEVYGFTLEPAVIVYNKALVPPEEVPRTRQELIHLLERQDERYRGRIATYDPERSGVGFLLATQDAQQSPQFWSLVRRLGAARVQLYANTAPILERIAEGRFLLGYNLLGSYAVAAAIGHPELGIVLPRDYTLAMSRLALIPRGAREPDLAREFMDFLLGEEGQRIIAGQAGLYAIHPWVQGAFTAAALREELGPALRPIQVGPGLLVYLDQAKRRRFLRQWREALAAER